MTHSTSLTFDEAFKRLEKLINEISEDDLVGPETNESDTRAKVIDRVLCDVLGWHERNIERETPSAEGFLDYRLCGERLSIIVEAKRAGVYFSFPAGQSGNSYVIRAMRSGRKDLLNAIEQARAYADDLGCEFACVTNGSQWAIFRAITPNAPWKEGKAIIFRSLLDIRERFVDFWNILSCDAVRDRSIHTHFLDATITAVKFFRAIELVAYADNPQQRNPLSVHIQPLIEQIFKDITSPNSEKALRECYVSDRKVEGIWSEVKSLFSDTVPLFAKEAGFQDLVDTPGRSGALDTDFKHAVERGQYGTTILLLGGIGSGKTTFIHRFFRVTAQAFVSEYCVWFYVPFTQAPQSASEFKNFLRAQVLVQCKERGIDTVSFEVLRAIYKDALDARRRGVWAPLSIETQLIKESEYLERVLDAPEHCDFVLRHLRSTGKAVVIVLDNVDQRNPEEQMRVFLLGQELCRAFDAIIMVALREESFFQASRTGAFNAYHNIRYHIASPDVRKVLRKRLELALQLSEQGESELRSFLRVGSPLDVNGILHFMNILRQSALERNPAIANFIDSLCQGNIREALDMFNQFMVSGTTNVYKMLDIYRQSGEYNVAEHEFVKAVMLGDYQFYRETRSPVINLYAVSSFPNASNLMAPRLLGYLDHYKAISHPEGHGFRDVGELYDVFEVAFGASDDARFHMARLAKARLVETEARDPSRIAESKVVRITKAGSYYLKTLGARFVYMDLVSLDTPVWDSHIAQQLGRRPGDSDLYARIERVEWFLCYLAAEARRSLSLATRDIGNIVLWPHLAESIVARCRADVQRVINKVGLDSSQIEEMRERVHSYGPKLFAVAEPNSGSAYEVKNAYKPKAEFYGLRPIRRQLPRRRPNGR